jgi:hypothetical protein
MSRLTMVLAAAVATGMLVVAVSTLDAVGADPPAKAAATDITGRLADCLRSRDVAVPALSGDALDRWLQTHRLPDATVRACKTAVAPRGEVRAATTADVKQLGECLRAHGFAAPSAALALKQWIGEQHSPAALRAIKECGVVPGPAPCGAAKKPSVSPKATRPDAGAADPAT